MTKEDVTELSILAVILAVLAAGVILTVQVAWWWAVVAVVVVWWLAMLYGRLKRRRTPSEATPCPDCAKQPQGGGQDG